MYVQVDNSEAREVTPHEAQTTSACSDRNTGNRGEVLISKSVLGTTAALESVLGESPSGLFV